MPPFAHPHRRHRALPHSFAPILALLTLALLSRGGAFGERSPHPLALAQPPCITPTPFGQAAATAPATATTAAVATAVASAAATGVVVRGTAAAQTATAIARGTRAPVTPVVATGVATSRADATATAAAGGGAPGGSAPVCTPTPAASASPSATPAPPEATPTPVPPAPVRIYLPLTARRLQGRCPPRHSHADLVLVIDTSTSMRRPTRDGRTKLDAALAAARVLLGALDLPRDRAAIVGFNDSAWTAAPLGGDRLGLDAALAGLPADMAEGTRLDRALAEGGRALAERDRDDPARQAVLVLLTDGLPNRVPTPAPRGSQEDTVLATAAALRDGGITIYSVGLGAPGDRLPALLEGIAGDTARSYLAPDAEDLEAIYRAIAGAVRGCP